MSRSNLVGRVKRGRAVSTRLGATARASRRRSGVPAKNGRMADAAADERRDDAVGKVVHVHRRQHHVGQGEVGQLPGVRSGELLADRPNGRVARTPARAGR